MGRVETHDEARRRLKVYEAGHRRRAREQGCEFEIVDLWEIVEEQGFMCAICHEPLVFELDSKRSVSIDHIHPLAAGGSHTRDNIQMTHKCCNFQKAHEVDVPMIAQNKRIKQKHEGTWRKSKRPMPHGKDSPTKRTLYHGVVER